jgi:hypothetical protein
VQSARPSFRASGLAAVLSGRNGSRGLVTTSSDLAQGRADPITRRHDCPRPKLRPWRSEIVDTRKLILTVFAAFAQFEREVMLERQREGIAKAKAEGYRNWPVCTAPDR